MSSHNKNPQPQTFRRKGCKTKNLKKYLRCEWRADISFSDVYISYCKYPEKIASVTIGATKLTHKKANATMEHLGYKHITKVPTFFSCTYFRKTNSYNFSVIVGQFVFIKNSEKIHRDKSTLLELNFDSEGRPSFKMEKQAVFSEDKILKISKYFEVFLKLLPKDNAFYSTLSKLIPLEKPALFYLLRAPQLKDLPLDDDLLLRLFTHTKSNYSFYDIQNSSNKTLTIEERNNRRRRIYYHLSKGDTKAATRAFFCSHRFPKSLQKQLLRFLPLPQQELDKLNTYSKNINTDILVQIIKESIQYAKSSAAETDKINDVTEQQNALDFIHAIVELMQFFNYRTVINNIKEAIFAAKVIWQLKLLTENHDAQGGTQVVLQLFDEAKQAKSFKDFHRIISQIDVLSAELLKMYAPVYSPDFKMQHLIEDGRSFCIRSPYQPSELILIGEQMNNCVGGYCKSLENKKTAIALIFELDKCVVCIEVRKNKIEQAKLRFNRPVFEDKTLQKVVMSWADFNNLKYDCCEDFCFS